MRLDTHLHVMFEPFFGRPPVPVEAVLEDLAQFNLDGGWFSAVAAMTDPDPDLHRRCNDRLAEVARQYPGRADGFCTVHPVNMEKAVAELERCARDLGLIGLKLHPWLQAFSVVSHPGLPLLMEACGELGLPVLFHDGTPPYCTSRQIAWLAEKHPRTQVILGHTGLADLWPDAVDAGRHQPNLWLQPCGTPPLGIRAAVAAVGPQRVLFGSDAGFGSSALIRYRVAKYRTVLGEEEYEAVLSRTPVHLRQACRRSAPGG